MERSVLSSELRNRLKSVVEEAKRVAEEGVRAAVARLRVGEAALPRHLDGEGKALRRALRAHARALGNAKRADGGHQTARLIEGAAYEHALQRFPDGHRGCPCSKLWTSRIQCVRKCRIQKDLD